MTERRFPSEVLSVCVCTLDRVEFLERAVISLKNDPGFPQDGEVLVVNSAATERCRAAVECGFGTDLRVRYTTSQAHSLGRARNHGLQESRAEVIAYLDDDVVVQPGWSEALLSSFADSDALAVTGKIEPAYEGGVPPAWAHPGVVSSIFSCPDYGNSRRVLERSETTIGCNMAYRRDALEEIGGFHPGLQCSDEAWVCARLRDRGATLLYEPRMAVRHFVSRQRMTLRWLIQKARTQGGADQRFRLDRGAVWFRELADVSWRVWYPFLGLVASVALLDRKRFAAFLAMTWHYFGRMELLFRGRASDYNRAAVR